MGEIRKISVFVKPEVKKSESEKNSRESYEQIIILSTKLCEQTMLKKK